MRREKQASARIVQSHGDKYLIEQTAASPFDSVVERCGCRLSLCLSVHAFALLKTDPRNHLHLQAAATHAFTSDSFLYQNTDRDHIVSGSPRSMCHPLA
ncbi:hypothetical protein Y032_0060g3156 [Ancylostoma ceylanicum]|uniref:Uncharacterized protein n=1 Tax=Ancylostoma ceylanicum TaxID=53326 RepID=A0A016U3U9_9BILA|nr:hypothetical protein Y032_0060g3156 [Ancylostoma ceylanicum]